MATEAVDGKQKTLIMIWHLALFYLESVDGTPQLGTESLGSR